MSQMTRPGAHDLVEIFEDVSEHYFGRVLPVQVVWCPRLDAPSRGHEFWGEYRREKCEIAVAERLNRRRVPRYLLEYVLHHELCHHVRWTAAEDMDHSLEFEALEALFEKRARALAWLVKNRRES